MIKKDIFLLLGGNKLNYGVLNKFKQKGYLVYVIDWNKTPQLTGDKHYQIDVKDYETIINTLKKDNILDRVIFAYSSIDLATKSVAYINRAIGLKTITDEGLKCSSSKSMMTQKWAESGLLNRISNKYNNFDNDIIKFNKEYKIIIKPDNSSSSRGITILEKNSNEDLIKASFEKALNEATNKTVVVEEFVEGTEFTVEMIGDSQNNVCVYGVSKKTHTNNTDNNKIAVKLHYNSVSNELQEKIADFAIKCYKALGFSSSFGHLEILLKNDGSISPVEIGARSSGFIASDLVDIVSGADFINDLIEVQNGKLVENGLHTQTDKSSMYFFYDFPNNSKVKKECNLLDFISKEIKSRYFDRDNIKINNIFKNIDNDNARYGFEILEGPKSLMTSTYIEIKENEMLKEVLDFILFDCHIHNKNKENGGFLVGLEGEPFFENTLNNKEVLNLHDPENNYISFYYVSQKELFNKIEHKYLKYHARREKYSPDEVIKSIEINQPKCVMIDTLNEPFWQAYDYWKIARSFPDLVFIFAHSGGYLINDFIKICNFQKNVWIDFSLTHTVLGCLGNNEIGLPYINQAINYSLHSPFKNRILMSSDFPFFNQEDVFSFYKQYINLLNNNFLNLLEKIK